MWIKIMIRNKQCFVCKGQLPEDYEFAYCCSGTECGCNGLPLELPVCSSECGELFWGRYLTYKDMWE
jgi:hypothetical protein